MTEHFYEVGVSLPYSVFAFMKEAEKRYPCVEKALRQPHIIANSLDLLHDLSMFHSANYTVVIDYPTGIEHVCVKELAKEAGAALDGARISVAAGLETFGLIESMTGIFGLHDYEEVIRMGLMHTADLANALLNRGRLFLAQPPYTFSPENVYTPKFLHPFRYSTFQ